MLDKPYLKYLYFTFVSLFVFQILVASFFELNISNSFFILFSLLIIPFISSLIKFVVSDFKYNGFIVTISQFSFVIALVLLAYTPISILIGDKKIAEGLSIYAYYFLVIGVLIQIISSVFDKNKKNEK